MSFAIVVIAEETITDCRFEHDPKHPAGIAVIELLEKSMLPERFTQPPNAPFASVLNDIGAKVSTPVPLQFWKALAPILVILEEKDAMSLLQRLNAFAPIDVRFWVL